MTSHRGNGTREASVGQAGCRVLHVVTTLECGGAQKNALASVLHGRAAGHDDRLAAGDGPLAAEARFRLGEAFHPVGLVREIAPARDAAAFLELVRLMRRLRPRIVHTHSSKAGILGRFAAVFAGVPRRIHTIHGWPFHRFQRPAARAAFVAAERAAAGVTERLVCVSEADVRKGLAAGIGRRERYRVIRSGVDFEALEAVRARRKEIRARVRRDLAIPEGDFVVATVANFKPQKDPLTWARVAARLATRRDDVRFLFVGDGVLRDGVERIVRGSIRAGNERILLLSWRNDVPEILAASDAFLLTSKHEGLPRALVEAARLELPIVASKVDGVLDVVEDGVTGRLVSPGDVEGFVRSLEEVIDRRDAAASFGAAARARTEGFSLERMFEELEELYGA